MLLFCFASTLYTLHNKRNVKINDGGDFHLFLFFLYDEYHRICFSAHINRSREWFVLILFNSLWPSDAMWCHRTSSTLVDVMACCLMAPSHYINQCLLIISGVLWQSPEGNCTENAQDKTQPSISKISFAIICLKLHSNRPGTNELTCTFYGMITRNNEPGVGVTKVQFVHFYVGKFLYYIS